MRVCLLRNENNVCGYVFHQGVLLWKEQLTIFGLHRQWKEIIEEKNDVNTPISSDAYLFYLSSFYLSRMRVWKVFFSFFFFSFSLWLDVKTHSLHILRVLFFYLRLNNSSEGNFSFWFCIIKNKDRCKIIPFRNKLTSFSLAVSSFVNPMCTKQVA